MRSFTKREQVMLWILSVIIMGACYYFFFFTPVQARIQDAQLRTAIAQDQQIVEQVRVVKMNRMKKEIEEMKAAGLANNRLLPEYDNLKLVMMELNGILLATDSYQINFPDSDLNQRIIQRVANISFTAADYAGAKGIIQRLSDSVYRCSIDSVGMEVGGSRETAEKEAIPDIGTQSVSVSLTVTFYEKKPKPSSPSGPVVEAGK